MTDFWASKLAGNAPVPASPPVPLRAWWSVEPYAEAAPMPTPPGSNIPPPVNVRRDSNRGAACPECGSGNYMQPARNSQHRCFDCNYPVVQSTSGARIGTATPFGKPVRQVTGTGWHPQEIIGRLG